MADKIKQILEAAALLRKGDVASGMRQIVAATEAIAAPNGAADAAAARARAPLEGSSVTSGNTASLAAVAGVGAIKGAAGFVADPEKLAALGIDPERLKLAQIVGSLRLRMIQEQVQQKYLEAYTQQLVEAQQQAQRLHEQQQEAAQLALIMEAASAQAEMAKQSLEDDAAEHHWHRRLGRKGEVCGHWKRGHCARGDKCQFGHPEKEKGLLQPRGPADIMRHNFKTSLCKNFASGSCPQGVRCMFAHGPKELRAPGAALSTEEEEIVQRVAAAKMARPPGSSTAPAASGQVGVPAPMPLLPPGTLTSGAGAAAALQNPWASFGVGVTGAGATALQSDSSQAMALASLAALNVDPSQLGIAQPSLLLGNQGTTAPAPLDKRPRLS